MSYAFNTLKKKINMAGNGDGNYSASDLDKMIYEKYQAGKLSDREYNDLCVLMEYLC